jgi:predicted Zn-dependent protease with MMP-like domain/Tfp pilus assembly protein PilF
MNDKDRYWDCLDQAIEASNGGRTDEALAWLDEALKVDPNGAEAHNSRGEILWDELKYEEALSEFELATRADPKFMAAHLNRAELLIEDLAEYEQAIEQCDELLAGRAELAKPDKAAESEIYYLKSKALFYMDDLEGALFLVRRALRNGGEHALYRSFEGQVLFELGQYEEARRQLEHAVALDPDSAHALYHLGLALERIGQGEESMKAFTRANALAPETYLLPIEMSEEEFREVAAEAIQDIPRSMRRYVEHVPVLIEDFPSPELMRQENVSPQVLGLFFGVPRTDAGVTDQPHDMDRVILFKKNLEKICQDRSELVDEIKKTVRHEIGHYLGLDEDDLERLGLA